MLERIFIRNYRNTGDPKVRTAYAVLAGVFGVVTNLLLGVAKVAVGLLSNSISIMADAVNNISDCASSLLTIIGFRLAAKEPDREHPYGHARYEYLFGFAIGIVMFLMGVLFAKESVSKIIRPQGIEISVAIYWTLLASIAVKILQMLLYRSYSRRIESPALEASASDSRNDVLTTTGIVLAMVMMQVTGINIDGPVGLLVSVFVMISSFGTIKEEMEPLIGIKPTPEYSRMIVDKLRSYPIVLGIHDLVLHNYGVHNDFVTVHVEIDARMGMLEAHDQIDNIEVDFRNDLGIQLTIHMDPVVIGNKRLDDIKTQIEAALNELNPELKFHDVRMVEGDTHSNVILDVVVSPEHRYTSSYIQAWLSERVRSCGPLNFVVEIDIPFC